MMPLSAICKGEQAYVGAVVQVKWNRWKFYEAEILKLSSECSPAEAALDLCYIYFFVQVIHRVE